MTSFALLLIRGIREEPLGPPRHVQHVSDRVGDPRGPAADLGRDHVLPRSETQSAEDEAGEGIPGEGHPRSSEAVCQRSESIGAITNNGFRRLVPISWIGSLSTAALGALCGSRRWSVLLERCMRNDKAVPCVGPWCNEAQGPCPPTRSLEFHATRTRGVRYILSEAVLFRRFFCFIFLDFRLSHLCAVHAIGV